MRLGLIGAQGTGKTTLARAFSSRWHYHFAETSLSKLFKLRGIEVRSEMDFDSRLDLQRDMLDYLCENLPREDGFVSDRTPIDVAAYTLSIAPYEPSAAQCDRLEQFVLECIEAAEGLFDTFVLVQPGIEIPAEDLARTDRGVINYCSQHRITASSYYLMSRVGSTVKGSSGHRRFVIPGLTTDLEDRLRILDKLVTGVSHIASYHRPSPTVH